MFIHTPHQVVCYPCVQCARFIGHDVDIVFFAHKRSHYDSLRERALRDRRVSYGVVETLTALARGASVAIAQGIMTL